MTVETNIQELRSNNQFWLDLLPSNKLVAARQEFDQAGKNPDPSNWAKTQKRINKANNLCAKLVREQYYPIIKRTTLAFIKDFKLSADEMNKEPMFQHVPAKSQVTYDVLFHLTMNLVRTSIQGSNAFLHIANAVKPMILRALKELADEGLITAHRPRRSQWGRVSSYSVV